jgi:hypothetical protein
MRGSKLAQPEIKYGYYGHVLLCCSSTYSYSKGRWHRLLNKGLRRLRGRRTSIIPPYEKGPTRSVRGAQTTMSPAAHGTHRGNSNLTVLQHFTTHALGRKVPDNALGDPHHGKNTTNGQPTRSLDGSPRSLRQCKNAPQTVLAGPRTPYEKGLRQPPTTSALRYKRSNTSAAG